MTLLTKTFLDNLTRSPNDFDCIPRRLQVEMYVTMLKDQNVRQFTAADLSEIFRSAAMRSPSSGKPIRVSVREAGLLLAGLVKKGVLKLLADGSYSFWNAGGVHGSAWSYSQAETSNYAFKPIADEPLRSIQTIVPQRLNAALDIWMNLSFAIEVRVGGRGEDRAVHFVTGDSHVFVVADGACGVGGGAFAADCVVRAAERLAYGEYRSATEALCSVDLELCELGCMSTGVIVEVRDGVISGASCGDSVAWLIQKDRVVELTEQQLRKPLLGAGGRPVSFEQTPFQGTLMLATDGLVNYTSWQAIVAASLIETISNSAVAIAELPRMKSGSYQDDVAVILCRTNV